MNFKIMVDHMKMPGPRELGGHGCKTREEVVAYTTRFSGPGIELCDNPMMWVEDVPEQV